MSDSPSKETNTRRDGIKTFYAESKEAWRNWLAQNYNQEKAIWLIIYKKATKIPSVYYDEALNEALCYGWIDSKINKRDEQSYFQYFAARSPKSNWSRVNKEKIARLLEENKMAEPGLKMVEIAKENGTWDALNDVENLIIPPDLEKAFENYSPAKSNFQNFPHSIQRSILEWIFNAKRAETRAKRIQETASLAQDNIRANQYRPK